MSSQQENVLGAFSQIGLTSGMQVLDAGCGDGDNMEPLVAAVSPSGHVTGVDVDAGELSKAEQAAAQLLAAGQVSLIEADLADLPMASRSFDAAWSSWVFHHLTDPAAALTELTRVVRPGGVVAVADADLTASFPLLHWSPDFEQLVRTAVWKAAQDNYGGKLDHHFDGYLARRLASMFLAAGLEPVGLAGFVDIDLGPLSLDRRQELSNWYLGPFLERIRDYLPADAVEQLVRFFDLESPDCLLHRPDYFQARSWFLVWARTPSAP